MSQKEQKHDFWVGGVNIKVSKSDAEYKLNTIKERKEPRKYYIKHHGRVFAVNQALEALDSRLMRASIQTQHAVQVFKRLGFKVGQK